MIKRIKYWILWWKWFLEPAGIVLRVRGEIDKATDDILFQRWLDREPKR
jgi:hypothetical protein